MPRPDAPLATRENEGMCCAVVNDAADGTFLRFTIAPEMQKPPCGGFAPRAETRGR